MERSINCRQWHQSLALSRALQAQGMRPRNYGLQRPDRRARVAPLVTPASERRWDRARWPGHHVSTCSHARGGVRDG